MGFIEVIPLFSYMNRGRDFYRDVVSLALPIILQNLIASSMGFLDTFMVGLLGEGPMAAVTLANIPVFVIQLTTFGLQSGASVLISQYYGKGDKDSINRVLGIGLYAAGGLTLLFGSVLFFVPEQFMGLFGNDPAVIALAARYARLVAFSYFFSSTTQVYLAAHRSMANPKLGLYVLTVPMFTNTFLNWVFIFGKFGFPAMGVEGAALATLLSCMLQFVIVVVHAFVSRSFRLRPSLIFRPGHDMVRRYIRYAAPVVLNEALWGLGNSLYPTIMGHMEGSQPILAAHGLSGNIVNLAAVMAFGVAGSVAIIIGREIGAGRQDTVYEVGLCLDTLAFLTGLVTGLVAIAVTFLVLRPYLYPLFDLSPEAGNIATIMLMVAFSTLSVRTFNSANVVGVLRGGGDVRMASLIDLSPLWLVAIPLAALSGLVFQWGILAVQVSIAMENVVKFFLGVARLRSGAWIRDVTAA